MITRLRDWLVRLTPNQLRRHWWLRAEYARRVELTRMVGLCREARRLARLNADTRLQRTGQGPAPAPVYARLEDHAHPPMAAVARCDPS